MRSQKPPGAHNTSDEQIEAVRDRPDEGSGKRATETGDLPIHANRKGSKTSTALLP